MPTLTVEHGDLSVITSVRLNQLGFTQGNSTLTHVDLILPPGWSLAPRTPYWPNSRPGVNDHNGFLRIYYSGNRVPHGPVQLATRYRVQAQFNIQLPRTITAYVRDFTHVRSPIHKANTIPYHGLQDIEQVKQEATDWLDQNFPNHRDPLAYW